jgi:DNA topoisomerase-6 subunit B
MNLSNKTSFAEISPSEFFYRNRDLAGFTNPARALYMAVRELVENSMDACELSGITPNVYVRLITEGESPDAPDPRPYRLTVRDNGPGIAPQHVPSAFGKVFYGSKYVLRQSRGMFGMGGTMAVLYGQITTNRPVTVVTSPEGKRMYGFQMMIDIGENRPMVLKRFTSDADGTTGTKVDLSLEGDYLRASQKITDYFKQTALVASYASITYVDPLGQITYFERVTNSMPPPPKETLPHPHGIDVEAFKRIVKLSEEHDMKSFMVTHFHRVGEKIATKFLEFAGVSPRLPPKRLSNNQVVALVDALQRFPDFLQPDASCLSPVGEEILLAGINKELKPEFSTYVARPPSSYSGFPFLVEVGVAYGGKVIQPGVKLFRYANRIPLLYDESSDVSFKVLNEEVDWKRYHVPQDAPVAVISHICSTKIPYKTVGKEYIADRPEIERDIKNAAREALRRLGVFLSKKGTMEAVQRKMNIYGKYLPLIARFATELADEKKIPNYRKLIGESETAVDSNDAPEVENEEPTGYEEMRSGQETESEIEQKKIDEYRGS